MEQQRFVMPRLRLPLVVVVMLMLAAFNPAAAAQARTGTYKVVIIRVTYSDTSPLYSQAQLTQAAGEIRTYFGQISYDQLDVQVSVVDVTLAQSRGFYFNQCQTPQNESRDPCPPPLIEDAAQAAAAGGFNFTDINGISLLSTFCAGDVTNGPIKISRPGVNGTFQRSYDFECATAIPPGASGVGWQGWAHEFGHQLQLADGTNLSGWNGHPGGYASGYDLMDSCYPCHESVYGLSGPPVMNGSEKVFSGWLPAAKVVNVNTPNSGTTVVLAPLEMKPSDTNSAQGIQVPVAPGVYYLVEVRRRLLDDTLQGYSPQGIFDEGVHILEVEESRNPPVKLINACDTTVNGGCVYNQNDLRWNNCVNDPFNHRDYCWPFALWHVNDTYTDTANGIQIKVSAAVGNGFAVTVTRGVAANHPDLYLVPWLTPPMNGYETIDIWLDSSCNGYESDIGPTGLRYGRRQDGTVIGNGDDPCANHENRIYAHVRNIGDTAAGNVLVTFQVSDPLGVGMTDDWTTVGTDIAFIPAGSAVDVYTPWTPNVSLTPQQINDLHFKFHTCVRVIIQTVPNEVVTSNNEATENFENFEAVKDMPDGVYMPIQGQFHIKNGPLNGQAPDLRTYYLDVQSALPPNWAYSVAGGEPAVTLALGETREIPVAIQVPPEEAIGHTYLLQAQALTQVNLINPAVALGSPYRTHRATISVGGVILAAQTVLADSLSLAANRNAAHDIAASGGLVPGLQTLIAVDFTDPLGNIFTRLPASDVGGNYQTTFAPWRGGLWTVRSLWQGNLEYASVVSDPVYVTVEGSLTCQPDFNGDRAVNGLDLQLIAKRWHQTAGQPYDADRDNFITVSDIAQVVAQVGRPCS